MDYFFRTTPDAGFAFNMHLVRLGLVLFLFFVYRFRAKAPLMKGLLLASVFLQGVLFLWYSQNEELFLLEGLPLYHCRIAGICLPFAYFLDKRRAMAYFADLALIGTVVAFAVPDPSAYAWPHITNVTYVLNHYVLMACGLLATVNFPRRLAFGEVFRFCLLINLFIFFVDLALSANYGYLTRVPIEVFKDVPVFLVCVLMTLLMALAIYLVEIFKRKFRDI